MRCLQTHISLLNCSKLFDKRVRISQDVERSTLLAIYYLELQTRNLMPYNYGLKFHKRCRPFIS